MEAFVKGRVISVGEVRAYTNKRGEAVTVQDAYLLIGESPRPISVQADPALSIKEGETSMYAVSVFPSRFDPRELSITLKGRVTAQPGLKSA